MATNEPWKNEPDYKTWFDARTGLRCAVIRKPWGHLCGYVRVPKKSVKKVQRLVKAEDALNLIIFKVHGGITFSGKMNWPGKKERGYWVGFDCDLSSDYPPYNPYPFTFPEGYKEWGWVRNQTAFLAFQVNMKLVRK